MSCRSRTVCFTCICMTALAWGMWISALNYYVVINILRLCQNFPWLCKGHCNGSSGWWGGHLPYKPLLGCSEGNFICLNFVCEKFYRAWTYDTWICFSDVENLSGWGMYGNWKHKTCGWLCRGHKMWKLVEVLLVDNYQTFRLLVVELHLVVLLNWSETT